jgi:hypothetical protein
MAVSASASTLGRWRGKGTGPVIGSGGGKASASFVESDAAGCCCGTNGEFGKTLGAGAGAGAACTVTAAGAGGAAGAGAGERAAVEATWTFGAALLPALSRIRSLLPSSVALASVIAGAG